MHAWNNQGGKGRDLTNNAIKALFFTTVDLNILHILHMLYVPSQQNPVDAPSRSHPWTIH